MTATNSSKPARDGTSASFTLEVASESVSGNIAQKTYLGSPSTEALVEPPTHADVTAITTALGSPAQDGTDSTGVTQLAGGIGIRGWLSGIFSKLVTVISTLNAPMQNSGGTVGISGSLPAFGATPTVNLGTLNGAATAAKQPALGTAGSASADVVTIQGAASMTPVKVDGSAVTQPVSGAFFQGTQPVSAADGQQVTIGAIADAAWSGSGTSTVIAALKAIYAKVAGIIGVSQSGTWTVQPGNTANTTLGRSMARPSRNPSADRSLRLPAATLSSRQHRTSRDRRTRHSAQQSLTAWEPFQSRLP